MRGPDVAFIAEDRVPKEGIPTGFFRAAPDLAVEVVSPSNTAQAIGHKVREYLEAGTREVWVVDPQAQSVSVHGTAEPVRMLAAGNTLEGGEVVPGFRLEISELFQR